MPVEGMAMATNLMAFAARPSEVDNLPEFEQLYARFWESVYRTARRITGDAADAEDILQTVFLRLLSNLDSALDARSAEAYLRRAAINASIDVLRRRASRAERSLDGLAEKPSGDDSLLLKEQLRRALAALDPEDAELFLLRHLEGFSTEQLAGLFGIERGTVGSRLFRIRRQLQKLLEG